MMKLMRTAKEVKTTCLPLFTISHANLFVEVIVIESMNQKYTAGLAAWDGMPAKVFQVSAPMQNCTGHFLVLESNPGDHWCHQHNMIPTGTTGTNSLSEIVVEAAAWLASRWGGTPLVLLKDVL